jgi:hypothetical protein
MSALQSDVQDTAAKPEGNQEPVWSARQLAMEGQESRHHEAIATENGYELDDAPRQQQRRSWTRPTASSSPAAGPRCRRPASA